LSLKHPEHFRVVTSPHQAFQTFGDWRGQTGRILNCLWNYQLPLFHPDSYWRLHGIDRDLIHFASLRRPNKNGCYALLDQNSPSPERILDKGLHKEIWVKFGTPPRADWCTEAVDSVWDRYSSVIEELEERGFRQDPTCQAGIDEFIFLGPFEWLWREVACVDFCHSELGIPRNDRLYEALETLLRSGSIVLTFEKLCILCDRPVAFEPRVEFSDGSVL